MANQNTTEIIDSYKRHLGMMDQVTSKHSLIKELYDKMYKDIAELNKIYILAFKNIHTDKKQVYEIVYSNAYVSEHYSYRYKDGDILKKIVFLNRDGFSFSNPFVNNEKPEDRSNYLQSLEPKDWVKNLVLLSQNKSKIIDALVKENKKQVAVRFFEALENSGFNTLSTTTNFDYLKEKLSERMVYYYRDYNMDKIKVNMIEMTDASHHISVEEEQDKENRRSWGNNSTIRLDDLEKISQIFDELMEFLEKYYQHLYTQDMILVKFYNLLRDAFAKELIINSLKDDDKDKKNN